MVTKNVSLRLGLVNGAVVQFYGFARPSARDDDDDDVDARTIDAYGPIISPPAYMLVRLLDDTVPMTPIPGLPPCVVPIEPVNFTYK